MVLRASSLAAVTSFVWSTRLKPTVVAHSRTTWRTATTSSEARTARRSLRTTAMRPPIAGREELHAPLDVEGRPDARQRQAELDEGDRDRGPHAHDHRRRIEHTRHTRDVREHASDERV